MTTAMTTAQMREAGIKLNGGRRWGWKAELARRLEVDYTTVLRMASGETPISVRTALAIDGLLAQGDAA